MTELYYLQSVYDDVPVVYDQMVLHIKDTDLWFVNDAYTGEDINNANYTKVFWDSVKGQQKDYLVKIGDL